jgi:TRAP-type mannitol/chloroaromatic compound transport system permease small subunit
MSEQTADLALARYTDEDKPLVLKISDKLRAIVDAMGRFASWMIVPLVIITCFDVMARKITIRDDKDELIFGLQNFLVENISPYFGSTMLQELEWHSHTWLFAWVLAYGYIWNTHVRVDLVRETLEFRRKAWIELLGITVFLIPFSAVLIYFASDYAVTSFTQNEISASTVGLSNRWIIKSVLVIGLVLVLLAGLSAWLQVWCALFTDPSKRFDLMTLEWPEEEGTMIEGKKRIELDDHESTIPLGDGAKKEVT